MSKKNKIEEEVVEEVFEQEEVAVEEVAVEEVPELENEPTVLEDYKNGITNLRFLAKKHNKDFNELVKQIKK